LLFNVLFPKNQVKNFIQKLNQFFQKGQTKWLKVKTISSLTKKTTKEKKQAFVAPLNLYHPTFHLLPLFKGCIIQKVVQDKWILRI
jgi:hypothetical protein